MSLQDTGMNSPRHSSHNCVLPWPLHTHTPPFLVCLCYWQRNFPGPGQGKNAPKDVPQVLSHSRHPRHDLYCHSARSPLPARCGVKAVGTKMGGYGCQGFAARSRTPDLQGTQAQAKKGCALPDACIFNQF